MQSCRSALKVDEMACTLCKIEPLLLHSKFDFLNLDMHSPVAELQEHLKFCQLSNSLRYPTKLAELQHPHEPLGDWW